MSLVVFQGRANDLSSVFFFTLALELLLLVSDRVYVTLASLPVNRLIIISAAVPASAQKTLKRVDLTIFLPEDANNYEHDINSEVIH